MVWGGRPRPPLSLAEKSNRAIQAKNVVTSACESSQNSNNFEGKKKLVNHAGASLLVPQRLNRIQIRSLPRRINPKQQPLSSRRTQSKRSPEK